MLDSSTFSWYLEYWELIMSVIVLQAVLTRFPTHVWFLTISDQGVSFVVKTMNRWSLHLMSSTFVYRHVRCQCSRCYLAFLNSYILGCAHVSTNLTSKRKTISTIWNNIFLLELWLHCSCLYWSACHLPAKFSLPETFARSSSLALGASGPLPPIHGPSYGPSSSAQANKQNSYGVNCVEKSKDPMGHMAHRQWEERLCALWHIVTIAASIARLLIARSLDTSSHLLTTSRSFSILYFSRFLGCTSVCGIHAITCTAKKR